MLTVFLLWLYICFVCIVIGLGTLKLLKRFFSTEGTSFPSIEYTWLTGLAILSVILSWISVFSAIGATVHIIILCFSIVLFFICYRSFTALLREWLSWLKGLTPFLKAMLAIMIFFILEKSSLPPMVYDTGLYHLQTMNWIESYPAVPGLGNLHDRLAFNSSWFITATFFRFSWLYDNGFYALNGLLFVIATLLGFRGLSALYRQEIRLKWTISLLFLFGFLLFIKQLSSPSPDMPVTVLIWMVLMLYMARDNVEKDISVSDVLCMLLPVVIISFKFSALPVIFLSLYMLIRYLRIKQTLFVFKIIMLMALIISPWVIRSVILSGYPVFPNTTVDLFDVDWKIPKATAQHTADAVIAWGRVAGVNHEFVLAWPLKVWLPLWFRRLFILDKIFLISFLAAVIVWSGMILFWFSRVKEYFSKNSRHFVMLGICLCGIVFWFVTAPDFRFVYGFFLVAFVILIYPLYKNILEFLFRYKYTRGLILAAVLISQLTIWSVYSFAIIKDQPLAGRLLFPVAPGKADEIETISLGNTMIYLPVKDDRCWNMVIPCTWTVSSGLQMRGNKIENGFKIQAE